MTQLSLGRGWRSEAGGRAIAPRLRRIAEVAAARMVPRAPYHTCNPPGPLPRPTSSGKGTRSAVEHPRYFYFFLFFVSCPRGGIHMRRILSRSIPSRKQAEKRGWRGGRVSLTTRMSVHLACRVLLDAPRSSSLPRLADEDPRPPGLIQLRYFGGIHLEGMPAEVIVIARSTGVRSPVHDARLSLFGPRFDGE